MPEKYSKIVFQVDVPWWAYEAVIWTGLAAGAAGTLWGAFGGGPFWVAVAGALVFVVLYWGSFVEPHVLTVKRFEIGKGARTVTIAYLSDLHAGPYKEAQWWSHVVARTNALGADLVLLGGDYILQSGDDARHLAPLAGLSAPLGVFGCLGNHDDHYGKDEVLAQFAKMRIPMIENGLVRLPAQGLAVAAVDDDWFGDTRFAETLSAVQPSDALVLLVHNPEVAVNGLKDMRHRPAVMLSGHDHGGQLRLPFIGPIPRLPHSLGRKFDRGLFSVGGVPLVIGQGVGESGPRARLFCLPQVVHVTLQY